MKKTREVVEMADLVSDLKWSQIVTAFGDYKGGAVWYTDFYSAGITNQYIEGYWKSFDCSAFDKTVNIDPDTSPFEITIYEFENGVKMVIDFWWDTRNPVAFVAGVVRLKYGNLVDNNVPYPNIAPSIYNGPYTNETEFKTYGCKICYITGYTGAAVQLAGGVIQDVTPADLAGFMILMPWTYQSQLQSWQHIHDGRMVMQSRDFPEEASTQPDGFFYPTGTATNGIFNIPIAMYDDLDTLVGQVQLLNSGLPIDKDKLIKKGGMNDPSQEDDPSKPGGGGGNYDDSSDPIDYPSLPTGGAISTGSIKSFLVDDVRVKAMFRRLWNSSLFDVITWQKIIEEPLDAIVSLNVIPCVPTTSGSGSIQLGNIDTEVIAPIINNQYMTIDCGTLTVPEFFGSALDYSPYVKVDCFLPFIGIRSLKPEDVINQTIGIKYNLDILTGNLSASIKCGQSVLYKFQGNCKATVPLTSRIFSALEAVMKGAGMTANAYATGAMVASSREGATAETVTNAAVNNAAGAGVNSALNVAISKVQIQRSGDISGSTGLLDDFVPYLIIHRPQQSLAQNFKTFKGYPSNISAILSSLTGYTEVEYVHLTGISGATDAELTEIEALLKSGVII
jgi:hypothetical protein